MTNDDLVELVLTAKEAVLPGGLRVRRAIPQAKRRMVGPFVFLDQMGPTLLEADHEVTVLPHPHIGLSTLTFLFEGEGLHRDSLGTVQRILPGEVNWMTAGRGIAHSERLRAGLGGKLFGAQLWVALPQHQEECEPRFEHFGADAVPVLELRGVTTKVIAGALFGARSAVNVSSPLFLAESRLAADANTLLAADYPERAAFVIEGEVRVSATASSAGTRVDAGSIVFFAAGREVHIHAAQPSRVLLLGGEPLEGPRFISWNFVSSAKERLQQAADDWRDQRFPRIPGETAYIPLPEDGNAPVNYP